MKTMLCQKIQLVSTNPDILERPRHAQLANNSIENVTQIRRAGVNFVLFQDIPNKRVFGEKLVNTGLACNVGALGGIELANSREQNAARFSVADSEGTQLFIQN
jgi:hypothetical protein